MDMLSDAEWQAILISLQVAGSAVGWILVPGVAIAWLLARHEFRGKALLDGLLHLPLVLPPVVVGYLLLLALGRQGWLGQWLDRLFGISLPFTWQGAAVAAGIMAFPLLVRAVRLSLEAVDAKLEAAASTLGAGPLMGRASRSCCATSRDWRGISTFPSSMSAMPPTS